MHSPYLSPLLSFSFVFSIVHPSLFWVLVFEIRQIFSHAISSWVCMFLAQHSFSSRLPAGFFCRIFSIGGSIMTVGTHELLLRNVRHGEVRHGGVGMLSGKDSKISNIILLGFRSCVFRQMSMKEAKICRWLAAARPCHIRFCSSSCSNLNYNVFFCKVKL